MNIYVYGKSTEKIDQFEEIIDVLRELSNEIYITIENKRSYRELENIKAKCKKEDIVVISTLASFGLNDADIATQLEWFIENSIKLVICNVKSSYEFGVMQPINKAVLTTMLQSILSTHKNIVPISDNKKSNAGRSKIEFPKHWDELYEKWEHKEISSKEFLEQSKLKKATFYNLITEYRELKKINEKYIQKYKMVR